MIKKLKTSKSDINLLGNDTENTYALSYIAGDDAHSVRLGDDGIIYIETSQNAISIHEITHVRQSIKAGGLEFNSEGMLKNSGTIEKGNINKYKKISEAEVEAYSMQYAYDPDSMPKKVSNINAIDIHYVGSLKDNSGRDAYPVIRDFSKYIKTMQKLKINIPF